MHVLFRRRAYGDIKNNTIIYYGGLWEMRCHVIINNVVNYNNENDESRRKSDDAVDFNNDRWILYGIGG